jgi:tripartite-type tricarboxylate transporter receptor subunit TctC
MGGHRPKSAGFACVRHPGDIDEDLYGVAAPAGTPRPIIDRLNAALSDALKSGELAQRLTEIGADLRGGTPEGFSAFWKSELDRYAGLVKLTGAKLD